MNLLTSALCSLCLSMPLLQDAPPPPVAPPAQTVATAIAKLQAQDFAGASADFEVIVAREPNNGQAWFLYGFSEHALGNLERALELHTKAATFPAHQPVACYNAACATARLGRIDTAFEWLAQSRAAGYVNFQAMSVDGDLVELRKDPRFADYRVEPSNSKTPFLENVTILYDSFGESAGAQYGWVARAIGDADGDGVSDFASTAPYHTENGQATGFVAVISGKTGKRLHRLIGKPGSMFGWSVGPAGDVDLDGFADLVVGAPGPAQGRFKGEAVVVSGKSGATLHTWTGAAASDRFGQDARGVGDVNGDGIPDLLVSAPQHDTAGPDAGRVYLISGKDGAHLHHFDGEKVGDNLGGGGVCGVWNERQQLLVASGVAAGATNQGRIYGWGGPTFESRFVIDGISSSRNLGWFLSIVPDANGDGLDDVYGTDWHDNKGGPAAGRAFVSSGKDGTLITEFLGQPGDGAGIGVGHAGDLDGDGVHDFVVGAWLNGDCGTQAGKVTCYSGKTGAVLGTLTSRIPGDVLGFDADGIGDADGDGVPDLLVTSAYNAAQGAKAGRTYVVSGASVLKPRTESGD